MQNFKFVIDLPWETLFVDNDVISHVVRQSYLIIKKTFINFFFENAELIDVKLYLCDQLLIGNII